MQKEVSMKSSAYLLSTLIALAIAGFAFLPGAAQAATAPNGTTSSLVGYWKLDDAGTTATDSSGYGNPGTYYGTTSSTDVPSSITFPDSASRSFNGTTDHVDIPSTSSLNINGAFTVSVWVNPNSLPVSNALASLISKYDTGSNPGGYDLRLYNNNGTQEIGLYTATSSSIQGGTDFSYTLSLASWSLVTGFLMAPR